MIIIISILVLAVCSFIVFQLIEYFKLHKQKPIVKDSTNSGNDMLQASTKKMKSDSDGWEITSRFDDGSIQSKVRVVDGVTEKHLFFENGNLYYKAFLVNENLQGKQFEYHENGNIVCVRNYIDDLQQGETIEYFESGEIQRKINFHKGKPNGKGFIYFKNGNVQSEGIFLDGVLDGKCVYYFESGILKNDYNFLAGKHDGEQLEYYENGNLREKGFFVDGKKHGKTYVLTEFGMVARDQNYENSELVEEKDNITELRATISLLGSSAENYHSSDNTAKNAKKDIDNILYRVLLVLGKVQYFTNEDVLEASTEENSEYLKLCEEIYETLLNEIKKFDKNNYATIYPIEDKLDTQNYFLVICTRAWNHIVDLDFDPNNKFDWQDFNIKEYNKTYAEDFELGKEHYEKTLEPPLICFVHIYNKLQDVLNKIKKLDSDFNITKNTYYKSYELLLAHTHAAIYAYHALLKIKTKSYSLGVEFKKTFKYFNYGESKVGREIEKAIKGENPEIKELITQTINDKRQKELQVLDEVDRVFELKNEKEQDLAINDLYNKFGLIAINQLSYYFIENEDFQKSIDILLPKLDDKDPYYTACLDTLCVAYYSLADYTVALHYSNLSIDLDFTLTGKNISEHYYNRARISLKIGETEDAKIDLKKAIEIDGYKDAKNLLEEISNLNN